MTVLVLSTCSKGLRGYLSRWLLEISAGVFIGRVTARVRDRVWTRVVADIDSGRAVLVYQTRSEQGLSFRTLGDPWQPIDLDGLTLIQRPTR